MRLRAPAHAIVAAAICNCTTTRDEVQPFNPVLASGTGTIVVPDLGLTLPPAGFEPPITMADTEAVGAESVSFGFTFYLAPYDAWLGCDSVSWATLRDAPGPLALATLCDGAPAQLEMFGASATQSGATIAITTGTLTVTHDLDAKSNGTVTMQLDIPSTDVVWTDASNASHTLRIAASALVGSATFATVHYSDSNTGCGGINPVP